MHPALSVVFFTSVSGAGYGLLLMLGLALLLAPESLERAEAVLLAAGGGVLATLGLAASLLHLGQPQRAWRALSQWRSSWLSREGVAALLGYLPLVAVIALLWSGSGSSKWLQLAGGLLALAAAATVYCTARIYTSLQPVPAWRHRLVLPVYVGFALLSGLLWAALLRTLIGKPVEPALAFTVLLLCALLAWLKLHYWRAIDRAPAAVTLAAATGLAGTSGMRPLEAPHTETNYLLREMGYVLARRHADRLRILALGLLALAALMLLLALAVELLPAVAILLIGLVAGQLGIFIERWLFFAQARHLVTVYYRG